MEESPGNDIIQNDSFGGIELEVVRIGRAREKVVSKERSGENGNRR